MPTENPGLQPQSESIRTLQPEASEISLAERDEKNILEDAHATQVRVPRGATKNNAKGEYCFVGVPEAAWVWLAYIDKDLSLGPGFNFGFYEALHEDAVANDFAGETRAGGLFLHRKNILGLEDGQNLQDIPPEELIILQLGKKSISWNEARFSVKAAATKTYIAECGGVAAFREKHGLPIPKQEDVYRAKIEAIMLDYPIEALEPKYEGNYPENTLLHCLTLEVKPEDVQFIRIDWETTRKRKGPGRKYAGTDDRWTGSTSAGPLLPVLKNDAHQAQLKDSVWWGRRTTTEDQPPHVPLWIRVAAAPDKEQKPVLREDLPNNSVTGTAYAYELPSEQLEEPRIYRIYVPPEVAQECWEQYINWDNIPPERILDASYTQSDIERAKKLWLKYFGPNIPPGNTAMALKEQTGKHEIATINAARDAQHVPWELPRFLESIRFDEQAYKFFFADPRYAQRYPDLADKLTEEALG